MLFVRTPQNSTTHLGSFLSSTLSPYPPCLLPVSSPSSLSSHPPPCLLTLLVSSPSSLSPHPPPCRLTLSSVSLPSLLSPYPLVSPILPISALPALRPLTCFDMSLHNSFIISVLSWPWMVVMVCSDRQTTSDQLVYYNES